MNKSFDPGNVPRGAVSMVTLICALWSLVAFAGEFDRPVRFDIPAQQLSAALIQFSSQTNVQVITKAGDVSGLQTSGVSGTMPIEIGLKQLLDGTGFSYLLVGDGTVEIAVGGARSSRPASGQVAPEQSAIRLVQVNTPTAAAKDADKSAETHAQAAKEGSNGSDDKSTANEVTVVGSRLSGPANKKAQPITVIDRDTIKRSGVSSIVQALNNLPEVSINATTSPFQSSRGSNTVQLRGLPGGTTLVLLNGRRLVTTPFQSSSGVTNLNILPLSAVERIEVLPSGSSAIYGGDALAGVVNIALKRDFEGMDFGVRYGVADDYSERQAALSAGHKFSRGNISFIASFSDNGELLGSERAITANTDYRRFGGPNMSQAYTSPANVYSLNGQNLPGLSSTFAGVPAGQNGVGLTPASFAATSGVAYSDPGFYALASQRPPTTQYSALLSGTYALNDSVELFGEMLYAHYEAKELDYPYYLSGGQFGTSKVPASNPFNPFGVDVGVNYLFKGAGRFCYCLQQEYTRPLAGIRGDLGNWKWEMAASLTRGEDHQREGPFLDAAKVTAALASTNPATALNVFADRTWTFAEIAPLTYTAPTDLLSQQYTFDGFIRGPLFQLPGGPVQVSFGAEYDRAKLDYGYYLTFFKAERHNSALSAEVRVPIVGSGENGGGERVALTGAVRYDDYSDFGEKTSPQVGIELRPWKSLLLRAAYSSAYKPPTLYQLDQPISTYDRGDLVIDPRRGRETYPLIIRQGGNPFLQALTGDSTSAGFVFSPESVRGLEISASHWTTKIDNYASFVSYQTMVDNESAFQQYITRSAPTTADIAAGLPGRINNILNVTLNYGTFDLAGVDMGVTYHRPLGLGELVTSAAATETYRYDAALTPGLPAQNRAGKANSGGFAPKWKGVVSAGWNLSELQMTMTGRYTGKYEDYLTTNSLGNFWLMDLNASYNIGHSLLNNWESLRGAYVSLGAVNVFNKLPVFSYAASNLGYDPRQYDIRGRFVYFQLGLKL